MLGKRFTIFLLFFIIVSSVNGQKMPATQFNDQGNFPIYNFSSHEYNAADQNWAIQQDAEGILYFGNNWGVLTYNGVNWKLLRIANSAEVKSMGMSPEGRIFIGSVNELGYLEADKKGSLIYHSLRNLIPDTVQAFGDIWNTVCLKDLVYFQTSDEIFVWNGKEFSVFNPAKKIHNLFKSSSILFVCFNDGAIAKMTQNSYMLYSDIGDLKKDDKYAILSLTDSTFLVATGTLGFFKMTTSGDKLKVVPFKTQADKYLKKYEIYNAIRIDSSLISVGTWGGGVVLLKNDGTLVQIVGSNNQLRDLVIQNQYFDRFHNLWLALSDGISRVEIKSPITVFNKINSLKGTVQSVCRFNNKIYAATTQGLFSMSEHYDLGTGIIEGKYFVQNKEFPFECWDLLSCKIGQEEMLLIITNTAIYSLSTKNKKSMVWEIAANTLVQSNLDPQRIFIGATDGIHSLYERHGTWVKEDPFPEIHTSVSSIREDPTGNLWIGTEEEGAYKIYIGSINHGTISSYSVHHYDSTKGLPQGPTLFEMLDGKVIAATSKGIYKYQVSKDLFVQDSLFFEAFERKSYWIHRMKLDLNDRLWVVTYNEDDASKFQVGFFNRDMNYHWHSRPFQTISENIIHSIFPEKDVIWFGGPEGLYRYEPELQDYSAHSNFTALIDQVTINSDSILFEGYGKSYIATSSLIPDKANVTVVSYKNNNINFYFSGYNGTSESLMRYSYFLEGFDENWSNWSKQTFKEFTNLPEGQYVFSVKARDYNGNESAPATFRFTVLPPWYRTIPAIVMAILCSIAVVYLIVALYTKGLRNIIRQRTAEIRLKKEELEIKNRDIMDSIHYASRIQNALLPPGDYLDEIFPQRFILYLPRDVVSGDFYWLTKKNDKIIVVTADCTGHGVPGAMMSMLGMAFLNEMFGRSDLKEPHEMLNHLRSQIIDSMRQTGQTGENQDGMDLSLYIINQDNLMLEFSGANSSVHIYRDHQLHILKGEKMPLGISSNANIPFSSQKFQLEKGDMIYTFSDGYQDQFGGQEFKRFKIGNLRCLLSEICEKPVQEQKEVLYKAHLDWKGNEPQVDDILVMGVKI